ncbi:competence protein ComK [Lederbergia lenta]|uniref:competence protein ComK n=1 Tax=Lederbergia lenta TaxID=1467 RepID=UPI00203D7B13|nr:competence protein ComK [Lederbergia lenta]MCM3111966.1 competence protein ComK [Lederbergia lenta]
MKLIQYYVINRKTFALIPTFDSYGHLFTRVIEGDTSFLVSMSPLQIIEESIIYFGNDYKGARVAAKQALGNIDMPPIKISGSLGIYWFPSMSPSRDECIWFCEDHIDDTIFLSRKKTKIILPLGHEIIMEGSKKHFDLKLHRARDYRKKIETRTTGTSYILHKPHEDVLIIKEHNPNSYQFDQTAQKKKN